MEKKIKLEEIFDKYKEYGKVPNLPGVVGIEFFKPTIQVMMFDAIKQALELAAENGVVVYTSETLGPISLSATEQKKYVLMKNSITDTLKQIE